MHTLLRPIFNIALCIFLMSGCNAEDNTDSTNNTNTSADTAANTTQPDATSAPDLSANPQPDAPNTQPDTQQTTPDTSPDTSNALCPPQTPFGDRIGDTAANITWQDCDGNLYTLHDTCAQQATWLVLFAGWCPKCRTFAADHANTFYGQFASESFTGWMIITETADFTPPDAAYCKTIRDQYGLQMPVLFDPSGDVQRAFGVPNNDVHIVMQHGNTIAFKKQYTTTTAVESAINTALQNR